MKSFKIKLPKNVSFIISMLIDHGHTAFAVGGCIRDSILGKEPKDWDITTSALVDESKSIFKDFNIIDTGIAHGTITIMIEKEAYELTTYRLDGEYKDNRRPSQVEFVDDISLDLSRRDFAINALAYNDEQGLIDKFGGVDDLKNKIIRTVNEPDLRFSEDALRILRALRFASTMGFSIEKATKESIDKNKGLLKNIAKERINLEFSTLLAAPFAGEVFYEFGHVFSVFLPEFKFLIVNKPLYKDFLKTLSCSPKELDIRLAILICFILKSLSILGASGQEKTAYNILKELRYSNYIIDFILGINKHLKREILPSKPHIKTLLKDIEVENFKKLLQIKKAYYKALGKDDSLFKIKQVDNVLHNILANNECYSLKCLQIKGSDLIKNGIKPGISVGKILNLLLDMVINEEIENNHERLVNFIKNFH